VPVPRRDLPTVLATSSLLTYLAMTFVLVVTPGASTAVVIRNTLAGGRLAGIATAAGAAAGNTSYAVASGVGLMVLLMRWPAAPRAMSILGALYFVWLGGQNLFRAARLGDSGGHLGGHYAAGHFTPRRSFREGFGVNLLNPAIATFYLGIVPSFVPAGAPRGLFALLAASHVGMAFACHSAWAVAFGRLQHFFARRAFQRTIEIAAGVAMLLLAWRVLGALHWSGFSRT
jgi:threonine/homoserine/homoserine lactone efflux protein